MENLKAHQLSQSSNGAQWLLITASVTALFVLVAVFYLRTRRQGEGEGGGGGGGGHLMHHQSSSLPAPAVVSVKSPSDTNNLRHSQVIVFLTEKNTSVRSQKWIVKVNETFLIQQE